jgi:alpha-amylase
MVDIVVNHNAWLGPPDSVNFSALNPFDQPSDYNMPYCAIDYSNLTENVSTHRHYHRQIPLPDCDTTIHEPFAD